MFWQGLSSLLAKIVDKAFWIFFYIFVFLIGAVIGLQSALHARHESENAKTSEPSTSQEVSEPSAQP